MELHGAEPRGLGRQGITLRGIAVHGKKLHGATRHGEPPHGETLAWRSMAQRSVVQTRHRLEYQDDAGQRKGKCQATATASVRIGATHEMRPIKASYKSVRMIPHAQEDISQKCMSPQTTFAGQQR